MQEGFCPDHTKFAQSLGEVHGKLDILINGQQEVKKDINNLWSTVRDNEKDSAVQKTRIAPVFWVLGIVATVIITTITVAVIGHNWNNAQPAITQPVKANK